MTPLERLPYREIWAVDFEFSAPPGERQDPICLVARELRSGHQIRLWRDQLQGLLVPPYPTGADNLFVAFFASAELGCHLSLGWPMPQHVLDLYVEFRNLTNGLPTVRGSGLVGALHHFGLASIAAEEKQEMRALAIRGGPWTEQERGELLDYCASDVDSLARLLPRMLHHVAPTGQRLGQALLRGRYMRAVAQMEFTGVPLDTPTLDLLRANWTQIQDRLIAAVDRDYGIYDGRSFRQERFARYLSRTNTPWPQDEQGRLLLDRDTFREMARAHPHVAALRELRHALSELRLNDLAVGHDGRNRCLLSPFRALTGRNQPSNSRFIFGPSTWLRGLIKPPPACGLAYVDFSSQEVAIAGALSGDATLQDAYRSGDVYLAFAKQAGLVPQDATKESHGQERDACKAVVLGVQYGMEARSMGQRIGQPEVYAKRLLNLHKRTYARFWAWSEGAVNQAGLVRELHTVFGWTVRAGTGFNPRSMRNFPCQANGAEMLRLACSMATEAGLEICAPVHDAILLCAPLSRLDEDVQQLRAIMVEASRILLSGFETRTDAQIVRYPHRFMDEKRGRRMWDTVMGILQSLVHDAA